MIECQRLAPSQNARMPGILLLMKPHCKICGSTKTIDAKSPALCQYLCYWILEGWLGWNSKLGEVKIADARAVSLFPDRLSYPKTIATARSMGWTGRENAVGTF